MATAILPQPAPSAPVDQPLAHEISDVEGIGLRTALVLAELYHGDLMAYAAQWDASAAAQACAKSERSGIRSERCPMCDDLDHAAPVLRGWVGVFVLRGLLGRSSHYGRRAQPAKGFQSPSPRGVIPHYNALNSMWGVIFRFNPLHHGA